MGLVVRPSFGSLFISQSYFVGIQNCFDAIVG